MSGLRRHGHRVADNVQVKHRTWNDLLQFDQATESLDDLRAYAMDALFFRYRDLVCRSPGSTGATLQDYDCSSLSSKRRTERQADWQLHSCHFRQDLYVAHAVQRTELRELYLDHFGGTLSEEYVQEMRAASSRISAPKSWTETCAAEETHGRIFGDHA